MFLSHAKADGEAAANDRAADSNDDTSAPWVSANGAETVLHYEIQTKLGQGGMGVVYKAIDKKLNRAVALKFLPPQIDRSSADLQRFLQEAQALSALNHPHIATIYAVEDAGGQQFLVLEFLPGGTLKAKLHEAHRSGGSLSLGEIFQYAQQTAEGLAHAHSRGIVHRDVKTSNLMLTAEGKVKITDFGVAKLGGSSLATAPGSLMGTIAYMSPEQALGMDVDARSDVFSFGVCLFELITGRLPFEAPNDAALITKVASARAPDLKEFRAEVPASLERVVQRAMKKRVEDRYQAMDDVLKDLQDPSPANLPVTQTRPRISVRAPVARTRRRARWIAAASLVSLVAVLTGVVISNWWPPRPKQLVVLRFRNVSGFPSDKALCDGLTELLTNKLSQIEQSQGKVDKLRGSVSVLPASDVRREGKEGKREVTSAQEAKTLLGAALVVEGAVQRVSGRVLVTVNLVDTAKGIVDAADVSAPDENLAELLEPLVRKASNMLKMHLNPEAQHALAAELPKNPGAYEFYLKGRGELQRFDRVESLDSAIELFQKALARDENYALAHAGIAEAYYRKYKVTTASELIARARNNAYKAMELNASLWQVQYAMGLIHAAGGEYDAAIQRFNNSIKIYPHPDAYRELANVYDSLKRLLDAEKTYRTAIEMRPEYWAGYRDLARFHLDHGRLDKALPLFEKVVELTPDNASGWSNIGSVYLKQGKHAEAIELFQKSNAISPASATYNNLGTTYYQLKRYEDAIQMYKKAVELQPTLAAAWGTLGDLYRDKVPESEAAMLDAYKHAIELIEEELLVNPFDGRKWARIATYRVSTDREKALKDISQALKWSPEDWFVVARAASVYEQSDRREEAVAAAKAAIELGAPPSEFESWVPLAPLLQDPRYRAFMEERARKSSLVPPSNR